MKKTYSEHSRRILFITNGHGEDLVAVEIIKRLGKDIKVSALPVVGEGKAYQPLGVKLLGPRKKLPSGGFSLRNLFSLPRDILAGLAGNTFEQVSVLRAYKGKFDLAVAIGDIVPIIGALLVKTPFIFVGVNKSFYYKRFGYYYTPWEKFLLQRYAKKVFVRDKITEENLLSRGIKIKSAEYVGNPLMDCIEKMTNDKLCAKGAPASGGKMTNEGKTIIGFLPGTREDAQLNVEDFAKIIEEIVKLKNSDFRFNFTIATTLKEVPEYMEKKPFAQVLAESDLIIGLSGTGNEQAAGSRIPVVSFYGRGSQYNQKFAEAQNELLGEALFLVRDNDPISVAAEVLQLLRNPARMKNMGEIGQARMGEPGAVDKIADFILKL